MALVDHVSLFESIQYEFGGTTESLSTRRKVASLSPKRRKERIKEEQLHAAQARVAKEASRPKLLMDDSAVLKLRTPRSYIEEARERYNRRTRSSLPSGRTSPFRTHISASVSHRQKSPDSSPSKVEPLLPRVDPKPEVTIPSWVLQRDDFATSYQRIRATRLAAVDSICRKDAGSRTPSEKLALRKWAETVPPLAHVPTEALDRLQAIEWTVVSGLIEQVEGFYVVWKGTVKCVVDGQEREVKAGEYFGAETVTGERISQFSFTPLSDCVLLRLKQSDYEQISMSIFMKEKRESTDFLGRCCFFNGLPGLKVQRLSRAVERWEYSPQTVLYRHGDPATALFIVKYGAVQLQLPVTVGQNYRWPVGRHAWEVSKLDMVYNLTIKTCGEGEFFGENELEAMAARKTSARCVGKTVCYVVSREKFLEVFTPREISDLQFYGNLTIPSQKDCELQVLQQFKAHKDHKQALVTAANLDYGCPGARDSILDRQTKKMMKWIKNLRERSEAEERSVRKGIVRMRKDRVIVQSVEMLGGPREAL